MQRLCRGRQVSATHSFATRDRNHWMVPLAVVTAVVMLVGVVPADRPLAPAESNSTRPRRRSAPSRVSSWRSRSRRSRSTRKAAATMLARAAVPTGAHPARASSKCCRATDLATCPRAPATRDSSRSSRRRRCPRSSRCPSAIAPARALVGRRPSVAPRAHPRVLALTFHDASPDDLAVVEELARTSAGGSMRGGRAAPRRSTGRDRERTPLA